MVLLGWCLLAIALTGGVSATPCEPCKSELCASPPSRCAAGYATDRCGCCQICARTENQLCDKLPEEDRYGICGENLECTSRKEDGGDPDEFVCKCREVKMVCSNEGETYSTICSLNEESINRGSPDKYNPQLSMEYWGPCIEPPVIMSPPEDSYGPLGANLTLDSRPEDSQHPPSHGSSSPPREKPYLYLVMTRVCQSR